MKKVSQVGCAQGIDKTWKAMMERKKKRTRAKRLQEKKCNAYKNEKNQIQHEIVLEEDDNVEADHSMIYGGADDNSDDGKLFILDDDPNDDLPSQYRHVSF